MLTLRADPTCSQTPKRARENYEESEVVRTLRARSHAEGLTLAQQNAVDLLAAGKNDTETAELLKLTRVAVTRWRLYSPEFRAALAVRRAGHLRGAWPQSVCRRADPKGG